RPRRRRRAGDPLTGTHPRTAGHLLNPRAVRRPEDELVRVLVVEVDEARVGGQGVGNLARYQREHLLEVERRVDRGDRLGQETEVSGAFVHPLRFNTSLTGRAGWGQVAWVTCGPMSVPATALLETAGYLVADARGRVVGRVECPMYGTAPDIPDALSVRAGFLSRRRRLVPADAIEQIYGASGVIGLRVERESIRSFL